MFYLICLVPLGVVAGLAFLSFRQRFGLKGLAFHPFNLLGFFVVITVLDFLVAYSTVTSGESIWLSGYSEYSPAAVRDGMLFFAFCSVGLFVGCLAGSRSSRRAARSYNDVADRKAATAMAGIAAVLAAFTVAMVVVSALAQGSISYVAATKGVFFRDNQILYVLYSMLLPAFFLFGSRMRSPAMIVVALIICLLLLLPIGSRGSLAILMVGALFWLSRRVRIPLLAVYAGAPIVAFGLTFYRWAVRDSSVYGTFQQFLDAHGGLGGALFNTPEISLAEAITINVTQQTVDRAPWESILGVVLIPVPRSIVSFKPFGASTEFTQGADLARWLTVKAEWTVTGFVNLLMEFGFVGAILLTGLLAFVWARTLVRASTRFTDIAFVGPVLIYFMYVFYRADIYNLGTAMWPALLVLAGHAILRETVFAGNGTSVPATHHPIKP